MKKVNISIVSILFVMFGVLSSCSIDNIAINESALHKQTPQISFSDSEYKLLGTLSRPNSIGLSEAKECIAGYIGFHNTRIDDASLQEIGILTKGLLGTIPDSVSMMLPDTLAYVFYSDNDERYIVASADNRVSTPILAFMSNGNLLDQNESLEKCQIIEMLRDYIYLEIRDYESNRESLLQEILDKINNGRAFTRAKDDPEYSEDDLIVIDYEFGGWYLTDYVDQLLRVAWSQEAPYNDKVKNKENCGTVKTGCVATAVAQICSFWKYPKTIENITLNWDNLTAQSRIYAHETNKVNQVSTLMKVIGEGSGMNYGCSESHTDAYKGRNWLNTIGYSGGDEYSYDYDKVVLSLKAGCPVLARGERVSNGGGRKGHTWVIDGYAVNERKRRRQVFLRDNKTGQQVMLSDNVYTEKDKSLDINWGWGGNFNGWFPEGCFDAYSLLRRTTITRSNDDDNRNYEYTRKIFVGLKPSSI